MQEVLAFFFYIWATVAIMYELCVFMDTKIFINMIKERENRKNSNIPETENMKMFSRLMFLYTIWNVIGLFSSQFLLFIVMLLLSVTIPKRKSIIIYKIDALLTLIVLLSIILNKYHFHYDILSHIKSWL